MANLEVQEKDGKIYCPLKGKWLIAKPEEKVRQKFIATLINEYGYTLDQMAQELELTGSKRGKGHAFADIVIWKSKADKDAMKDAFIIIETKAENVKLHVEDYYQGSNYAKFSGAEFFVASNEKETKFFTVVRGFIPIKCSQFPSCVDFTGFNCIQNCVYCYYLSFFSKIALKHRPHYFHI